MKPRRMWKSVAVLLTSVLLMSICRYGFAEPAASIRAAKNEYMVYGDAVLEPLRETEHFLIYGQLDSIRTPEKIDEIEAVLEGCYATITGQLKRAPAEKTRVNIFPDTATFNTYWRRVAPMWPLNAPPCGFGIGSSYYYPPSNPESSKLPNSIFISDPESATPDVLVHEFGHVVVDRGYLPKYLHEGVPEYLSCEYLNCDSQWDKWILQQVAEGKPLTLSELFALENPALFGDDFNLAYGYGRAYVGFIEESFGFDAVLKLLDGKPRREVFGTGDEQLNEMWLSYLSAMYGPQSETDHCWFYFEESPGDEVLKDLDNVVEEVNVLLGLSMKTKATIHIYSSREAWHNATGWDVMNDESWILGGSGGALHMLAPSKVSSTTYDYPGVINAAKREYAWNVAWQLNSEAPNYMLEGSVFYAMGVPSEIWDRVRQDVQNETPPTLSNLEALEASEGRWNYAAGYMAILFEYITDNYGSEYIGRILSGEALTDVLNMTQQEANLLLQKAAIAKVDEWFGSSTPSDSLKPDPNSGFQIESMEWGDALTGVAVGRISIGSILNAFTSDAQITITDAAGNAVSASAVPATGMAIEITNSAGSTQTAVIVVTGDVLGSGQMNISQLVTLAHAVTGAKPLTGAFLAAGDLSGSGSIDIADLVAEAKLLTQ